MKRILSYCRVSARDKVRSSFQAKASSRLSPVRSGRCRSLLLAGGLAKRALLSAMNAGQKGVPSAEAVLQRLVGALDPPFRRARIGADDVEVERVQGAAKLGHPATAEGAWMV